MNSWGAKTAIAGAVLAIHAGVLGGILRTESRKAPAGAATSETVFATAEIIQLQQARDRLAVPDLQLITPVLSLAAVQEVRFDDSIEDELAAVISRVSAPRLARVQSVGSALFARRAHLLPGHAVTVVLRVEVMEDGLVDAADVARSSGDIAADTAAIDYALELRWIPGTIDHKPRTMRVNFPITLAISAAPSQLNCSSVRGYWRNSKCNRSGS
jgi:TonB family protein